MGRVCKPPVVQTDNHHQPTKMLLVGSLERALLYLIGDISILQTCPGVSKVKAPRRKRRSFPAKDDLNKDNCVIPVFSSRCCWIDLQRTFAVIWSPLVRAK
jgi:hypothetical protein